MAKNRSAAGITNIVQYDANRNITFVSGSTTLLTVSSSGALTTSGTITATTLVVQTVTSSVNFITGSTKFGSISANTHTFTGSMSVTGAFYIPSGSVGIGTISPNQTLHIDGLNTGINLTGGNNRIYFSGSRALEGNGTQIQIGEGHAKTFLQTSTAGTVMTITGSSVGIGMSSPFALLSLPSGTGWNGGLAWNYTSANSSSKKWWINTDQIVYGDFRICTEITQGAGVLSNASTLYERLYIGPDGTVGINTTGTLNNSKLYVYNTGGSGNGYGFNTDQTGTVYAFQFYNPNGRVGRIDVSGTSTAYVTSGSDIALKKNLEDWTEDVLTSFKNIKPQLFNYKVEDDESPKTKGYIANDSSEYFPEAYPIDDEGLYSFNPSGMVVYLMKALKETAIKIEQLEAQNDSLQSQINELKA